MSGVIKSNIYYEDKLHRLIERTNEPFLSMGEELPTEQHCNSYCPGYSCYYKVINNTLYLQDLVACTENYKIKNVDGIYIEAERVDRHRVDNIYKNINKFIDYTGNLLMGSDIEPYFKFSFVGTSSFWQFKDLKELVIKDGIVTEVIDRSKIAMEILQVAKELPYDDFVGTELQGMQAAKMREDDIWWLKRYQHKES